MLQPWLGDGSQTPIGSCLPKRNHNERQKGVLKMLRNMKKTLKKRLIAALLSLTMIGSVSAACITQAYAAETDVAATSDSVDDAVSNTKKFTKDVIANLIEAIPNPLAKFFAKSTLDAYTVYFEQEGVTDTEQITNVLTEKCDEINANIDVLSRQSNSQYNEIMDKLINILDMEKLSDYKQANVKLIDVYAAYRESVSAEVNANGFNRLDSEDNAVVAQAYRNMFSSDMNRYFNTLCDNLIHYRSTVNGQDNDVCALEYMVDSNTDTITRGNTAYDFNNFTDADQISDGNQSNLEGLQKMVEEYCDICKSIAAVKRTVAIADGMDEATADRNYAADICKIDNIYMNNGDANGNIHEYFQSAYDKVSDYRANSDIITIGDVSHKVSKRTELMEIVNKSLRNGADVTVTLQKDWIADNRYGFADSDLGTQWNQHGYNSDGAINVCDGGKLTFDGNGHQFDLSSKSGATAFSPAANSVLSVRNLEINGAKNGIVFNNGSAKVTINVDNVTFHCSANAIYYSANDSAKLNVANSRFLSAASGAVIVGNNADFTINDSVFDGNTKSGNGAAIELAIKAENVYSVKGSVSGCTFSNNKATGNGGAVSNVVKMSSCTFDSNTANGNGGAFCEGVNQAVTLTDCRFVNNHCDGQGGAIYLSGTITRGEQHSGFFGIMSKYKESTRIYSEFTNVTVSGNTAGKGGADLYARTNAVCKSTSSGFPVVTYDYSYTVARGDVHIHGGDRLNAATTTEKAGLQKFTADIHYC